jgi:hypothetical protein
MSAPQTHVPDRNWLTEHLLELSLAARRDL